MSRSVVAGTITVDPCLTVMLNPSVPLLFVAVPVKCTVSWTSALGAGAVNVRLGIFRMRVSVRPVGVVVRFVWSVTTTVNVPLP